MQGSEVNLVHDEARSRINLYHPMHVEHVRPDVPVHELKLIDECLRIPIGFFDCELAHFLEGICVYSGNFTRAIRHVKNAVRII